MLSFPVILTALCIANGVQGFTTSPSQQRVVSATKQQQPRTVQPLRASLADLPISVQEMESARFCFWLCFFGATGAASAGRETIPQRYDRFMARKSLAGVGPTLGGDEIPLLPYGLSGYPEDIRQRDVEKIIRNRISPFQMIKKFPVEKKTYNYTHTKNSEEFLSFESFALANKGANPLAIRAVFDSITNGGDSVYAGTAQDQLELYKQDPTLLAKTLNRSVILGLTAFVVLIGLVGLADYFAAYHLYRGWFPAWPGAMNFPLSIFDKDAGLLTIPNYFMLDLPSKM